MVSPAERNNLERPQTKVLKLSKNEKKKKKDNKYFIMYMYMYRIGLLQVQYMK